MWAQRGESGSGTRRISVLQGLKINVLQGLKINVLQGLKINVLQGLKISGYCCEWRVGKEGNLFY